MKQITSEEAEGFGIKALHDLMDNGERRFRLVAADGSSYIRTEGTTNGGWQNSHFHKYITEFYLVQTGWIIYAKLTEESDLEMMRLDEGDHIMVKPMEHHNIYMSPSAVTHGIKYGGNGKNVDWFVSSELDKLTKQLKFST